MAVIRRICLSLSIKRRSSDGEGGLEEWSVGGLGYWSNGVLGEWSVGVME
jgi:hypothetical protein